MIEIDFSSRENNNINLIRSHNSLLIIGKGDSEYQNIKILFPNNLKEVEDTFGIDSQLTLAYKEAKSVGAKQVYLCNCFKFTDYIDALDLINQNDFACITPLFDFSTTFINPLDNRDTFLVELYSESFADSFTNIFFTDKHASLYESFSHYIQTMKSINYKFKDNCLDRITNGENLCFVLNNLKEYKFGNVVLAALISNSSLRYYPQQDLGEVVYDINNNDVFDHEFIYFEYDALAKTTVENMQNYYEKAAPEKMLLISIIKNRINTALNYDDFSGKIINAYTRIELENHTKEILEGFIDVLIEKYNILEIRYEKAGAGEINIGIYISIKPYNSIETINMKVEV